MSKFKMEERICFFCLANEPVGVNLPNFGHCGATEKRKAARLNVLLQYLLNTKEPKSLEVMKEVRKVVQEGSNVGICSKCEDDAEQIVRFNQELEAVQMKIIHVLKSLKERILQYFLSSGSSSLSTEEFRQMLDVLLMSRRGKETVKFEVDIEEQERFRRLVGIVSNFQMAIYENGKNIVDIPCVLLDRYSVRPQKDLLAEVIEVTNVAVKTEIWDAHGDDLYNDLVDNFDDDISKYEDDPTFVPLPLPQEDEKVKTPKAKQSRKSSAAKAKAPSPTTYVEIPSSLDDQGDKRKRRSAATLASSRLKQKKTAIEGEVLVKKRKPYKKREKPKEKKKRIRKYRARVKMLCELCPYGNRHYYNFEYHLRKHEEKLASDNSTPSFTCDKCSKSFYGKQYYSVHMSGHEGKNKIKCDYCNDIVHHPDILLHLKTHVVEKIFECEHCSFCCSQRDSYLKHLRFHGRGRLECDICSRIFRTKGKLLEHLHDKHNVVNKFVCEVEGCNKEFLDIAHLKVHGNIHKNPVPCEKCDKVFPDRGKLKIHMRAHTGEKPYTCSECAKSFATLNVLQTHQMNVHGAPKNKCEYCGKEYKCPAMLKVHLTLHEGTGIPCGICDKVMGSKSLWKRHQIVHTTELNFICEDCGKGFTSKQGLTKHAKVHGGEKKFKCQYCEKAFLFPKYLADHERTHTGDRPFTCSQCGKSFTQLASLYMHGKKCPSSRPVSTSETEMKPDVDATIATATHGSDFVKQDVDMSNVP